MDGVGFLLSIINFMGFYKCRGGKFLKNIMNFLYIFVFLEHQKKLNDLTNRLHLEGMKFVTNQAIKNYTNKK